MPLKIILVKAPQFAGYTRPQHKTFAEFISMRWWPTREKTFGKSSLNQTLVVWGGFWRSRHPRVHQKPFDSLRLKRMQLVNLVRSSTCSHCPKAGHCDTQRQQCWRHLGASPFGECVVYFGQSFWQNRQTKFHAKGSPASDVARRRCEASLTFATRLGAGSAPPSAGHMFDIHVSCQMPQARAGIVEQSSMGLAF